MAAVKPSRNTLLSEFPIPPTFIPQNVQQQATNPPPSRPPSLPLPPIPGPSPLSENDLYQITAAARSHRTSRLSTSSNSSSWRGSVASIASAGSRPSSLHAPAAVTSQHPGRNRAGSVNSARSNTSLPAPLSPYSTARTANPDNHRPPPISKAVNPAILEDDESLSVEPVAPSLTLTSLSDIPRSSPLPHPHVDDEPTIHGERLSSIDMRDLPALQDDDITDPDSQSHSLHQRAHVSRPKSPSHKSRIRQAMPRLQPQPSGNLTGGKAQRRSSSTTQHARNLESSHDASEAPIQGKSHLDGSDRASSPDVASILAATPRQRRRSETSSTGSRSRSQSRRRPPKSLPGSRRTSGVVRASVFSLPDQHTRQGSASVTARCLLAYADNADEGDEFCDSLLEDYGVVIGSGDGHFASVVPDEDDVSGDSDSSLDLHTPLPSLMLRDGLLSPHSKLLPQNIVSDPPLVAMDASRSVVSVKTKSGVFKDERDTTRRRVRHRDGRLLRGGIGLTTGLGWSDSEDEDAPSPLTRRLSHMALSRQSSVVSLKSAPRSSRSHPHPLSRSVSGDAKVYSSKSTQNLKRPSLPPTSWQSRSRTVASTRSLNIPEQDRPEHASAVSRFSEPPPSRVDIQVDSQRNEQVRTPSSSSTQSLPGPITPDVTDVPGPVKPWDREKNLPPIPLSRASSFASLRPVESFSDMKNRPPRLNTLAPRRPISPESELSDLPIAPHTPKSSNPRTPTSSSTRTTPRPLQLSASFGTGLQPGEPASMQGLLLGYNRQLHDQQRARASSGQSPTAPTHRYSVRPLGSSRSGSVDLSLSELGEPRLRPRTGTGMSYRKSSTGLTRAAAEVQAQSRVRTGAVAS
jgi:large subunit ribosomal protein LP1